MDITTMLLQMASMPLASGIGALIGSIGGAIGASYQAQKSQKAASKLLIKMELRQLHKSICVNQEGCSIEDKDDATQLYNAYKALGGNGTGESMYKDIMATQVTE